VDIVPKGKRIPKSVDDLAQIMNIAESDGNNSTPTHYSITNPAAMTDDIQYVKNGPIAPWIFSKISEPYRNKYTWAPYIYSVNEVDPDWNGLYRSNYFLNYVLEEIDNAEDGKANDRDDVKGQAYFHRAMNYFLLVNEYAVQYNKSTAVSDLAVPLALESDINKSHPRSTVEDVYQAILSDLQNATSLLKKDYNTYNHIPGLAAAYSLLARTYLFMGDYDKAYIAANEALAKKSTLVDYNTITLKVPTLGAAAGIVGYEINNTAINAEVMYMRQRTKNGESVMSEDLKSQFDKANDLRYKFFTPDIAILGMKGYNAALNYWQHSGIMTVEVWLTKAEAALRKKNPDINEAILALDYVRQHRYLKATYVPTTETDPAKLLATVLRERRLETRFNSLRWFDLKRLNKNASTAKTLVHTGGDVQYTLEPENPKYVLPIPLNVLQFQNLPQNPAPGR